jgi:hypothetical protein
MLYNFDKTLENRINVFLIQKKLSNPSKFCDLSQLLSVRNWFKTYKKSISLKTNNFTLDIEFQFKNETKFLTLHEKREKKTISHFSLKLIFYASLEQNLKFLRNKPLVKQSPKDYYLNWADILV